MAKKYLLIVYHKRYNELASFQLTNYSKEFCLKPGHGVFFGLTPIFVFASNPATPLSSSQTCTTIDGVEILFPNSVTSFDGCSS